MNITTSMPSRSTYLTRQPVPSRVEAEELDSYQPSTGHVGETIVSGLYGLLPVVSTFVHIDRITLDVPAISNPSKVGAIASTVSGLSLVASYFSGSMLLAGVGVACGAVSGIAGAVAGANVPIMPSYD